jgi:hypothetical protein
VFGGSGGSGNDSRWAVTECIEEAVGGVGVVKEMKQGELPRSETGQDKQSRAKQSRLTAKS